MKYVLYMKGIILDFTLPDVLFNSIWALFIIYLTNLEVYEETDDKNINKSMWS